LFLLREKKEAQWGAVWIRNAKGETGMGMRFVCGHCGELIHESPSSVAFPGWQQHEKCGHETYFDKFVYDEKHPEKQPVAGETRRFRDESADELNSRLAGLARFVDNAGQNTANDETITHEDLNGAVIALGGEGIVLPSAADLDKVAEEENLKHSTDGQELLKDFENHKTDAVNDEAADAQKAVAEHEHPPQGAE